MSLQSWNFCINTIRAEFTSPGYELVGLDALDELLDGGLRLLAADVLHHAPQVVLDHLQRPGNTETKYRWRYTSLNLNQCGLGAEKKYCHAERVAK